MEIKGKLVSIQPEKIVSDKFKKREFWIEIGGERTQTISLEFVQGFTDKLDPFIEGQGVLVNFNVMGRIYNGKCYNTLQAFSIELNGLQAKSTPKEEDSDLPF